VLDRGRVLELADAAAGRGKEDTLKLTVRLISLALNRLAKAGATGANDAQAAPDETAILNRLSPNTDAGRKWAELSQTLSSRVAHGMSVNLDPAGLILDMFLQIEATAARIK